MDANEQISNLVDALYTKLQLKDRNSQVLTEFTEMLSRYPIDLEIPYNFIQSILKNIVTVPILASLKSKLTEEFQTGINNSTALLQSKILDIEEKCFGLEHRIESARKKFGADIQHLHQKIGDLEFQLNDKPWIKEISSVMDEITQKPSFEDLYSIKLNIEPRIEELTKATENGLKSIKDFESALARMDEILLTKSSKDDIKYLNTQLDLYVGTETFEKTLLTIQAKLDDLFEKTQKTHLHDIQNENCGKISHRNTNKDFSVLFNKLSTVSLQLESKMDKSEILPIIQSAELKDIAVKRILDGLLFDFQQLAVLHQESLKTMIRSLDSAEKKNKQRIDLLKAVEKLISSLTAKITDNKNQISSKSANHPRTSQSPEVPDRILPNSLSRNSNRKSNKSVLASRSNRVSLNM